MAERRDNQRRNPSFITATGWSSRARAEYSVCRVTAGRKSRFKGGEARQGPYCRATTATNGLMDGDYKITMNLWGETK
ncbi:hypothetical protein ACFSL6_00030 [Paenibacillus thailandensis]|uniref:hypothetical protein n=1 Tax=Paenibacillus thailandensis TaxID=393250 RepID=UPI00363B6FD1